MKPPTEQGFYWAKVKDGNGWEVLLVIGVIIVRCGESEWLDENGVLEWGDKIEHDNKL